MWASGLAASLKGKFHYYSMSHRNTHTPCFCDNVANCDACLLISVLVHDTNTLMRLFGDYIRCIIPRRDWSLASAGPTASRQHCATHSTGCLCLSASFSQFRWWHDYPWPIASVCMCAGHLCPGFILPTARTLLFQVLGLHVTVHEVSLSLDLRFGTHCHLTSKTRTLVENSSNRTLRPGSLCKPIHERRLWELCLSRA